MNARRRPPKCEHCILGKICFLVQQKGVLKPQFQSELSPRHTEQPNLHQQKEAQKLISLGTERSAQTGKDAPGKRDKPRDVTCFAEHSDSSSSPTVTTSPSKAWDERRRRADQVTDLPPRGGAAVLCCSHKGKKDQNCVAPLPSKRKS